MKKPLITLIFICLIHLNSYAITPHERIEAISACIILESGGTSEKEMHAVANVIFNRAKEKNLNPYKIITQPKQFSSANSSQGENFNYKKFIKIAKNEKKWDNSIWNYTMSLALLGYLEELPDITKGSNHFHEKNIKPHWSSKLKLTMESKYFKFYKD